jgi:hypothetical protein
LSVIPACPETFRKKKDSRRDSLARMTVDLCRLSIKHERGWKKSNELGRDIVYYTLVNDDISEDGLKRR